MQQDMQQRNFGRGKEINMSGQDIDSLIYDIKNGNVQAISWDIIVKLLAELSKMRKVQQQEDDLK